MKELLTKFEKVFKLKQTNKQMYYAKRERRLRLFTRVSFIRMCKKKRGDWYYLVSSSRDVYA